MEPNAHSDCPLLRLPSELITKILSLCPKPSLLILCRVSRCIREFSLPFLYCDLCFVNPSRFIKCCRNLVKYDAAAFSVRHLSISFQSDPFFLSAAVGIVRSALPRLSQLRILVISIFGVVNNSYSTVLQTCHFPHLFYFGFQNTFPFTSSLDDFLRRHSSTINRLLLDVPAPLELHTEKEKSLINFSILTRFEGNAALLPRIQLQKSCSSRRISLNSFQTIALDEACILDAVGHLQSQAGDTVKVAELLTLGFTGSLPRIFACCFPNITTLTLLHLSLGNPDTDEALYPTEICFENLKAILTSFQQLTGLCVARTAHFLQHEVASLEESCRMVTVFGSICPKLIIVGYGQYRWTNVPFGPNGEKFWIPHCFGLDREFEDSKITQWSLDMICAQDNPSYWIQLLISLPPIILTTDKVHVSWNRVERMVEEIRKRMVSRGIQV